ncbi:hypothetical protein HanOQP8_Chr09g0339831 [Helianthus annuus]|nr:hypothetical protein HanOQP8_Chr09g0339831 [Helianthus annuus]
MWLHFFTFESYGLYEVEQGGKVYLFDSFVGTVIILMINSDYVADQGDTIYLI